MAEALESPIIGADSRQIYTSIPIGTAAPTEAEQLRVRHYMVGSLPLTSSYSAAQYESDCLDLLQNLFLRHESLVVSGGSSMYIDALRHGFDNLPTLDIDIRNELNQQLLDYGLTPLVEELQQRDPEYWSIVDRQNPRRVLHALEICRQTGRSYSSFLTGRIAKRPFRIILIALCRPVEELYQRINKRVDEMIGIGLEQEARQVLAFRQHMALNTVGYKEMFDYFDGRTTLPQAIENIKSHTRAYARKQLTWLRRDNAALWFSPCHIDQIIRFAWDIQRYK